ncbi:AraC family transcriptional regulator [Pontibacter silvestris]|nr:AraC family transcriptional regulator [Pontibacter silvestris]
MEKARKILLEKFPLNDVSAELGYKSVSHFIAAFKKYGTTPKQYIMA